MKVLEEKLLFCCDTPPTPASLPPLLSPKLRNRVWPLEKQQCIQVLRKFTEPLFSQQLHHEQCAHGLISYLQ